jgi:hypothetical protein
VTSRQERSTLPRIGKLRQGADAQAGDTVNAGPPGSTSLVAGDRQPAPPLLAVEHPVDTLALPGTVVSGGSLAILSSRR